MWKINRSCSHKKLHVITKNCLLIKREYTFRTNQTPWNINTSVLPHFVSGADYMYSTKIYDSSTNALVSMICQWASDTLKHSACISTIRNNTFQTCSVKHVCLEHLPDVRLKACRNSSKLICPLPTLKTSHMYIVSQKRIPNILNYNSSKNCLTSIIFGKYINKRLGNQRVVYFPTLHKVSLHYLVKQKKNTKSHLFTLILWPTSQDFNQSLLDFFNLTELQLILMLMCESLNLIISGLCCWAVKVKAIIKRNEVESSLLQSDCVTCMMCQCAVLLQTKFVISDVCDSS